VLTPDSPVDFGEHWIKSGDLYSAIYEELGNVGNDTGIAALTCLVL
jgi:hypothetical protein